MSRYYFDTETDGLLDAVSKVHCLVLVDLDTEEVLRFNSTGGRPIEDGLTLLSMAEEAVAHNGIKYDYPVLRKLYPGWDMDQSKLTDTLVLSRAIYPEIQLKDDKLIAKGKLPRKLRGRHSLEAWGHRLGDQKQDYTGWCKEQGIKDPWAAWSPEMEDYCVQDCKSGVTLYRHLLGKNLSVIADRTEHRVQWIIDRQERNGVAFDEKAATDLWGTLADRKYALEGELRKVFAPFYVRNGKSVVPKRSQKRKGMQYEAGVAYTKIKLVEFNPGSRDHIARRLQILHGWRPEEFTPDGKPKIDETVLGSLPWPEAKLLTEYFTVDKRISQLATGDEAWLKHSKGGRIHGRVITCGAGTSRMAHQKPNLAQVPANYSPYGKECRALFGPTRKGWKQVGIDAAALEGCGLAGYMARYDQGAYIKTVTQGKKEDGTDVHTVTQRAIEAPTRDHAKTWFYAFIYGAGNAKLGAVLQGTRLDDPKSAKRGSKSRRLIAERLPALGTLEAAVKGAAKKGYITGLDGRQVEVQSQHKALNRLLQSVGAILMKLALIILDDNLRARGWVPGEDYEFMLNVHDEWQIETREEIAHEVGMEGVAAIRQAGVELGFRCPLSGEFVVGNNWSETH